MNTLKGVAFAVNNVDFFQLLGVVMCLAMGSDIKATIEKMRKEKVITEEEYSYIVEKMNGRLK